MRAWLGELTFWNWVAIVFVVGNLLIAMVVAVVP